MPVYSSLVQESRPPGRVRSASLRLAIATDLRLTWHTWLADPIHERPTQYPHAHTHPHPALVR